MKKTFRTILSLTLALALLGTAAALAATVTGMSSYAALIAAANGIALPDAPQGSTNVQYNLLQGDQPIAQIRFTLDGVTYHLRASACKDEASVTDISGMKAIFGSNGLQSVTGDKGAYQFALKGATALSQWYSEKKQCQYTLLTDGAANADTFKAFTETLLASAEAVEAVQEKGTAVEGTVKKLSKTSITLTDDSQKAYTFAISGRTVNTDSKSLKKGVTVRVNYTGEYAEGCEAIAISVVAAKEQGGGKGGKASPKPSKTPKPTATPKPDKQLKLSGTVTMLAGNLFEVQTDKNQREAFLIEDAQVTGGDTVAIGDKASVVYTVQKDAVHLVSVAFTHVEPTPTPGPRIRTKSGVIDSMDTETLTFEPDDRDDVYTFDISTAKIKGDLDAEEGDNADVTYYADDNDNLIATVVVLSKNEPDPDPTYGPIETEPIPGPIDPDDPDEPNDDNL